MSFFRIGKRNPRVQNSHQQYASYCEREQRAYWEEMPHIWLNWPSPLRPSKRTIDIYRQYIARKNDVKHILILGSTPELRDLAAEYTEAKIWVTDFSKRMLTEMRQFTTKVDPSREKWVLANWLALPLANDFFDIIMGDIVVHQVTPEHEREFLRKIARLLKKDGVFISRFLSPDDGFLATDLQILVEEVLSSPFTTWQKILFLTTETLWRFANFERRELDRARAVREFGALLSLSKAHSFVLWNVYYALQSRAYSKRIWAPPLEKDVLKTVSEELRIIERRVADDCIRADLFPIYLMSPLGEN